MNNSKSKSGNKPGSYSKSPPSRHGGPTRKSTSSHANMSTPKSSVCNMIEYSFKSSASPTLKSKPGSCSIKRTQSPSTSSTGSCSIKRSSTSHSTPLKRPVKNTKFTKEANVTSASPSSTMTASTASPGSSISSPGTLHTPKSNRSHMKHASASISKLTLKSPPELKTTKTRKEHNEVLKSLQDDDGELALNKLNLTDKYQLWIFVSSKRKGSTKQEETTFLNTENHEECLIDLYKHYSPLDLKMLYWQTCTNAGISMKSKYASWNRETLGKAISKIVFEYWDKLSGQG